MSIEYEVTGMFSLTPCLNQDDEAEDRPTEAVPTVTMANGPDMVSSIYATLRIGRWSSL
jgi:hypothetical protein